MIFPHLSKRQKFSVFFITFPFLTGILFLIIGMFTLDDILLERGFRFNFKVILTFFLVHLGLIVLLNKLDKIDMDWPKSLLKRAFLFVMLLILLFSSSFLLEMGVIMNFNYWLKSSEVEKFECIVIDKRISKSKTTDYYVHFYTKEGEFKSKVSRSNYNSFNLDEVYQGSFQKGYFHGYFLIEPLSRVEE